ncbi:unnamed protein product [Cuscuta campestris]|uniref:Retrotransposon gag domain-containing protein n=1 Tax=Cuscuta campestris TaxID=132261 RepID=A0A484KPC6_9ASTE|nr:unnamed protein product [Cuscuta campestris]
MSQEEFIASNAELKAQVEYLAKEVAKLTKFKLSMVQTPEESEDEDDASSVATLRARTPEKSASDFKIDMPTFEGKNDLDDFLEWLETVERVFDFKDVSEEKKVKLVALKFRKYASTWWTNVTIRSRRENKSPVTSWTKMRTLLKKKFLPENYIRENFSKLQYLKQGSRSVEEYNREFEELLLRNIKGYTVMYQKKQHLLRSQIKKGFKGIVGGLLAKKGKRAQPSTSSSGTTVSSHNELAMYQEVPCNYNDDDVEFDVLGMLARQVLSVPVC